MHCYKQHIAARARVGQMNIRNRVSVGGISWSAFFVWALAFSIIISAVGAFFISHNTQAQQIEEQSGSITGYKWNDLNGNGVWEFDDLNDNGVWDSGIDTGEPGLEGWNIYMNGWDFSTETDENGYYSFLSLPDGEYFVCETSPLPSGWFQTYPLESQPDWCFAGPPTGQWVKIEGGNSVEQVNFGNFLGVGTIRAFKFNDRNEDEEWNEEDEELLSGWQLCLQDNGFEADLPENFFDDFEWCKTTDETGWAVWENIPFGEYELWEEMNGDQEEEGWQQTVWPDNVQIGEEETEAIVAFGNHLDLNTIHAFKYRYFDGERGGFWSEEGGWFEEEENEPIEGWQMCLLDQDEYNDYESNAETWYEENFGGSLYDDFENDNEIIWFLVANGFFESADCQLTDKDGRVWWMDLLNGEYVVVEEVRSGWSSANIDVEYDDGDVDYDYDDGIVWIQIEDGSEAEILFGNTTQSIHVRKFFDINQDGNYGLWWSEEGFWAPWGEDGGFFSEEGGWWSGEGGPGGFYGEEGGWFDEGGWYFDDQEGKTYGPWNPGQEPGISGWQICLYEPVWFDGTEEGGSYVPGENPIACDITDENGWVRFDELEPGDYLVVEEMRDGWFSTAETDWGEGVWFVELDWGEEETIEFGNWSEDETPPVSEFELPENGSAFNDTVVVRGNSIDQTNDGLTIPIEIVELQLRSAEPIVVNRNQSEDFPMDSFFDVLPLRIPLSPQALGDPDFDTAFQVDSFFDVFVEVEPSRESGFDSFFDVFVRVEPLGQPDSFFDITYRIDPPAIDSFFDIVIKPEHLVEPPRYTIDSFFDITYDVEFIGSPGKECEPIRTPGTFFGRAFLPNNCQGVPFTWSFLIEPRNNPWGKESKEPAEGVYKLIAHAYDKKGNRENTATAIFTYDVTPPEGEWEEGTDGSLVSRFVSLVLSEVSDNLSDIARVLFQYRTAESEGDYADIAEDTNGNGGWAVVWDTRGLELGEYDVRALITDAAGNEGVTETVLITLEEAVASESESNAANTSLTVQWTTPRPATSRVVYDTVSHADNELGGPPNFGYAFSTPETDTDPKVENHSVSVTGLNGNTTYYYRTVSRASPETVGEEGSSRTSGGHSCPEGFVYDGAVCMNVAPPPPASPSAGDSNESLPPASPPPPSESQSDSSATDDTGDSTSPVPSPTASSEQAGEPLLSEDLETSPPAPSSALALNDETSGEGEEAVTGDNEEEELEPEPQVAGAAVVETLNNTFAFPQMLSDTDLPLTGGALLAFVLASGFNPWLLLVAVLFLLVVYVLQRTAARRRVKRGE